ncbi:MAG: hypothetical protein H6668_04250 [Ardenticatenaceae bacterium]|nr:hypothetical protein [Ardenticatenaceae bacterium]
MWTRFHKRFLFFARAGCCANSLHESLNTKRGFYYNGRLQTAKCTAFDGWQEEEGRAETAVPPHHPGVTETTTCGLAHQCCHLHGCQRGYASTVVADYLVRPLPTGVALGE